MKHGLFSLPCAALLAALAFATGAQAQQPLQGAPLPHTNPPPPLPGCAEALAPLLGQWGWQERAGARPFSMEIAPGKDECSLAVQAMWPQSPAALYYWQFSVHWDAASKSYPYTGARHWHEPVMAPDGEALKRDVKYEDGSGALRLEGGTLLWDERKEGICKECRFRKVAPAASDADVPAVPDALELVSARSIANALRAIGSDGKGFHIVFDRVQRSADDPLRYTVTGKTYTGRGEQSKVRDFGGTLEVQRASLLPRTPANAERYKGYPDGVTRGSIEAHTELVVGGGQPESGTIQGTLRVPVLYGADGAIVPDHTLHLPDGRVEPDHPVLAAGGYANGEFSGTWTEHKSGASTSLTFSRQHFLGSDKLGVLWYEPKPGGFGIARIGFGSRIISPRPPKP